MSNKKKPSLPATKQDIQRMIRVGVKDLRRQLGRETRTNKKALFALAVVNATAFCVMVWLWMSPLWSLKFMGLSTGLIALGATMVYLSVALFGKQAQVHRWAIEQSESSPPKMTGDTQTDLQRMLDYHLNKGNIEEADKISKRLLAFVDNTICVDDLPESAGAAEKPAQQKTSSGLPSWMSNKEEDKSKLPHWMQ